LKAKFAGKSRSICGAANWASARRKSFCRNQGLKFLAANFRSARGEIDLVFRDGDCLAFVEVKTRSSEEWTRPAAAVDARKKKLLSQTALDYLKLLKNPAGEIPFRHRGGFAGRWRSAGNPASAEHVFVEQAVSLRVNGWTSALPILLAQTRQRAELATKP
jgi:putative endonuclease